MQSQIEIVIALTTLRARFDGILFTFCCKLQHARPYIASAETATRSKGVRVARAESHSGEHYEVDYKFVSAIGALLAGRESERAKCGDCERRRGQSGVAWRVRRLGERQYSNEFKIHILRAPHKNYDHFARRLAPPSFVVRSPTSPGQRENDEKANKLMIV